MTEASPWLAVTAIGVVAVAVVSLGIVRWLDPDGDLGTRLRTRFLLGVPWGTLVTIAGVLAVYLFVQDGWSHWYRPVTLPFRAWSYFYPLGMLLAPFSHNGPGHLTGNLLATAVLAPLAEYAWGHFPRDRGSATFASLRSNPYVRAFVAFPAGVVVVGILTSAFSWGPIIGFSGVVFAFAGFALVRFPIGVVLALAAEDVIRVVYRSLREPIATAEAKAQFVTPWWAGIAIQGHLLGLFLGIALGAVVLRKRGRPRTTRLWAGAVVVAVSLSLWAIWWFRGGSRYVLYRGVGVMLVLGIGLLVTIGLHAVRSDHRFRDVPIRYAGVLALVFPVLVVGFAAVPLNAAVVADAGIPGGGPAVNVTGYQVTYAENVTNGQTSVVDLSVLGETTQVRTSGVIVVNEEYGIWSRAVSTSRLAFRGTASVDVGGLGWRETVTVRREGWTVPGDGAAYRVWLRPPGGEWQLAFRSKPAIADPVIDGYRIRVRPAADGYRLDLDDTNETGAGWATTVDLPAANETAAVDGIRFVRENDSLLAVHGDTRVEIAARETYTPRG